MSIISLYFSYLKSVDVIIEFGKLVFGKDNRTKNSKLPYSLKFQIDMFILNSGNRAGLVKNLKVDFKPTEKFEEWYDEIEATISNEKLEKIENYVYSKKGIEKIEDHITVVKGGEGVFRKIDIKITIKNSELIDPFSMSGIEDVEESENLKELFDKVEKYKKEKFKEFIDTLKNREIGEFIVEGEITVPKYKICGITFANRKLKRESVKIPEEFIKHLESILENYEEIIEEKLFNDMLSYEIRDELKNFKDILKKSREDIERYWEREGKRTFSFRSENELRGLMDCFEKQQGYRFERLLLLEKCRKYKDKFNLIFDTLKRIYEAHKKAEFNEREIIELKSKINESEKVVNELIKMVESKELRTR